MFAERGPTHNRKGTKPTAETGLNPQQKQDQTHNRNRTKPTTETGLNPQQKQDQTHRNIVVVVVDLS